MPYAAAYQLALSQLVADGKMPPPPEGGDVAGPVKYAAGAHGTPAFNPPPHPLADPDAVAKRDGDPLWQHHRGLLDSGGYPIVTAQDRMMEGKPKGYLVALRSQIRRDDPPQAGSYTATRHGLVMPDHTAAIPTGFITHAEWTANWQASRDASTPDRWLRRSPNDTHGNIDTASVGAIHRLHPANVARYDSLFRHVQGGRRPWFDTIFPLQDLEWYSAPHDAYGMLSAAVLSGNRHAVSPLVDALKRRDNPAGWYSGWSLLHKAMTDRIGDLPPAEVLRRVSAVADATADSGDHAALAAGANHAAERGDFTGYAALADHMQDRGLDGYSQLMAAELANVLPHLRPQPKGRRRF